MRWLVMFSLTLTAGTLRTATYAFEKEETPSVEGEYIRESTTTYYGKESTGKWITFYKRRDVSLLEVKSDRLVYHVNGRSEGELFYTNIGERRKNPLLSNNTVPIEETYDLNLGNQYLNAPRKSILFSLGMPSAGFEYFFLPMYDMKKRNLKADGGVIELKSSKRLRTQFVGVSTYRVDRTTPEHARITFPYRVASSEGHYAMQGTWETTIDEDPLRFIDMKGETMVTVSSPEKWGELGDFGKRELFLEKFSTVRGCYSYRMLPMDSEEAKSIRYSDQLKDSFTKQR